MSILYQALSRAARDNAQATGNAEEAEHTAESIADVRPSRSFRSIGFRPRLRVSGGKRRHAFALVGVLVLLAAGWLFASTLPQGSNPIAQIPVASDVAEMVGLIDPEPILIVQDSDFEEFEQDSAENDTPELALAELDLARPDSVLTSEPPRGDIRVDDVNNSELTSTLSEVLTDVSDESLVEVVEPPATLPEAEIADLVAPGAPGPVATTQETTPDVASVEDVIEERETLEQTLARLANERGFDELQPPVNIDRTTPIDLGQDNTVEMTVEMDRDSQQQSFEAAYASLVAGNTESALNLYLDVLKDDPNNTFALFGLASTLQRIGWLSEARATYEELLAIEPENPGALTNMMALISQESPDQALANLSRLQDINPGFSPIPAQIGLLFAQIGDYPEAIRNMQLAISLNPDNMMYVYNLAIIYDRIGEHPEAQVLYERVLAASETRDITVPLEAIRDRVSYLKKL